MISTLARIAVTPDSKDSAKAIKETWGKRCNRIFFHTADEAKPLIPIVRTPSKSAFGLLCESIRNIANDGEDFDWLLVTTESTFALPENLRRVTTSHINNQHVWYAMHTMHVLTVMRSMLIQILTGHMSPRLIPASHIISDMP